MYFESIMTFYGVSPALHSIINEAGGKLFSDDHAETVLQLTYKGMCDLDISLFRDPLRFYGLHLTHPLAKEWIEMMLIVDKQRPAYIRFTVRAIETVYDPFTGEKR